MSIPADHREVLDRRDFVIDCSAPNFTQRDRELLTRYGHWLSALASGKIQAFTPAQEHFLQVVRCNKQPETEYELAWVKLADRRKFEAEAQAAPHFELTDPTEQWISRQESWCTKAKSR